MDLLQIIFQTQQQYIFCHKTNLNPRFSKRLAEESPNYYDLGYFGVNIPTDQQQIQYDVITRNQINFDFCCELLSKEPAILNGELIHQKLDVIRTKIQDDSVYQFDNVCTIVSDNSGYYLEVINLQSEETQCHQAKIQQSNKNRTCLFGILRALQTMKSNSSVMFKLNNRKIQSKFIHFRGQSILNFLSDANIDIIMAILNQATQIKKIKCNFCAIYTIQQRFLNRLQIQNKQNEYFDTWSNVSRRIFSLDFQIDGSNELQVDAVASIQDSYQAENSEENQPVQENQLQSPKSKYYASENESVITKSLKMQNLDQDKSETPEVQPELQQQSHLLLSQTSNQKQNSINKEESEPIFTKQFEFQNLTAEQQKQIKIVLMEMDVSFKLKNSSFMK
ncbi:Hypothetical_protein [Hexamita inflata]|uniref:Hypothetical_protein n=1 Tax=Hexamita inflata TaxID=28002 RepID=A0AA86UCC6_9EUKA|nr:Hypothetical protein HINF_LOCUS37709 [Hexamita inflata]